MIVKATYHSIWDGSGDDGEDIATDCKYDTETRRCFDIEDSGLEGKELEDLENLETEYVELEDGTRLGADEGVTFDY